jgi:hypothetical protein
MTDLRNLLDRIAYCIERGWYTAALDALGRARSMVITP